MATTLEHFDVLVGKGLKVIPLRANSKLPMYKGWNRNWNRRDARESIMRFPECNLGILLGDIIDVEGDTREANLAIDRLVDGYEHPTYRSQRSTHHLFRTPDPELRIFKHEFIEFRGHGHQSVLPPSRTEEVVYRWLSIGFPVPVMPEKLLNFYKDKMGGHEIRIKKGHTKVVCSSCEKLCFIHKKRFALELEALQLLGQSWQCRSCRDIDLRPVVRLLRREKHAGVLGYKTDLSWSDFSELALSEIRAATRVA